MRNVRRGVGVRYTVRTRKRKADRGVRYTTRREHNSDSRNDRARQRHGMTCPECVSMTVSEKRVSGLSLLLSKDTKEERVCGSPWEVNVERERNGRGTERLARQRQTCSGSGSVVRVELGDSGVVAPMVGQCVGWLSCSGCWVSVSELVW